MAGMEASDGRGAEESLSAQPSLKKTRWLQQREVLALAPRAPRGHHVASRGHRSVDLKQ